MIVSGLNHFAQKSSTKNFIDKRLKAGGYKRDDIIGMNDQELDTFARRVFPEMYNEGGNPSIKVDEFLSEFGLTTFDYVSKEINITIAPKSFTTNFRLAAVVGHELFHAGDYNSGRYMSWYRETKSWDYADNLSEVRAYEWNLNNNSLFSNYGIYVGHCKQINQIPHSLTAYKGN